MSTKLREALHRRLLAVPFDPAHLAPDELRARLEILLIARTLAPLHTHDNTPDAHTVMRYGCRCQLSSCCATTSLVKAQRPQGTLGSIVDLRNHIVQNSRAAPATLIAKA